MNKKYLWLLIHYRYRIITFQISVVRYSFFCQGTSTRRQRSDLFGLPSQAATCWWPGQSLYLQLPKSVIYQ